MLHHDTDEAWAVFDRPAGSERDLVVLAEALDAVIVQRHPNGAVRIVGGFGVMRWNGLTWHHEKLVSAWFDLVSECKPFADGQLLETLLEFAVHDLGARGIGADAGAQPDMTLESSFEHRLPATAGAADLEGHRSRPTPPRTRPRSTAPACSTRRERCGRSEFGSSRVLDAEMTIARFAVHATRRRGATAPTTRRRR